ncbi:Beta-glucanase precursor [Planctomycetes bacterium MalM25]|nr:Beta-glucanase precursor [Planctomycetes bacterium MalM25]
MGLGARAPWFALLTQVAFLAPAHADPPGKWSLVFQEDFNVLDKSEWRLANTNATTNDSLQDYLPQQVTVAGGNLVITSEAVPSRGLPYRSGQIISKRLWEHGRFEVRADLPTSMGMWPAIWLLADVGPHPWPSGGEIDIMENRGDQPTVSSSAFHYGTNPPFRHAFVTQEHQSVLFGRLADYHEGMHTYAVEWEESQLRFYIDDVHHYTVYDDEVGGFLSERVAPMNLIINTAIGGWFLDNPDDSTVWPQELMVDSVKVYERSGDPTPVTQRNTDFEEGGGSLAGWSPFGTKNGNVSVSNEVVRGGRAAAKLFGQFVGGENYSGLTQSISVEPGQAVSAVANAMVLSADSLTGTANSVLMKIEFYGVRNGRYGTPEILSERQVAIADGGVRQDAWLDHKLEAIAPGGAVEARLSFVFIQPNKEAGSIFLDDIDFATLGETQPNGE